MLFQTLNDNSLGDILAIITLEDVTQCTCVVEGGCAAFTPQPTSALTCNYKAMLLFSPPQKLFPVTPDR